MLDLSCYNLSSIEQKVFSVFSEISKIPRGSGNMKLIADYCENFAKSQNLKYFRDNANNVVIFKDGTNGHEDAQPIILQGHLDIVCQATDDCDIDFLSQGLEIYRDGDFIKAKGTTLGADNGIAVAYIMAILSSDGVAHPPIEAIFTSDEETGLIGAGELDCSILKSKRMINLDSEEDNIITVSCAGGQDVTLKLPVAYTKKEGYKITIDIKGLLGGHSGVEIDKNRTNANILLGEILYRIKEETDFNIISLNGGTKPNAIPRSANVQICAKAKDSILNIAQNLKTEYLNKIKPTEHNFNIEISCDRLSEYNCFDNETNNKVINLLKSAPYGVIKMSEEIENLVETSLNLGILSTDNQFVILTFALRSNKEKSLENLTNEVLSLGEKFGFWGETRGFYPPWEYNPHSNLRELYKNCYRDMFCQEIKVEAIHAGLECGLFSNKIKGLDCISVGPNLFCVHTPQEKMDILSAIKTFKLLLKVLKEA